MLEKRMYFFTMYNLSDIQKAIQCGHAALEYVEMYGQTDEYREFIKYYKTWIILNGGTSNNMGRTFYDDTEYYGSMEDILTQLKNNWINHSSFNEPDLNNATSAICFLVDERVFNKKDYPDFRDYYLTTELNFDKQQSFLKTNKENYPILYKLKYDEWVEFVGGVKNVFLRDLIKDKRTA